MLLYHKQLLTVLVAVLLFIIQPVSPAKGNSAKRNYLGQVNTPTGLTYSGKDKIIVAVVDDGVRITHKDLRGFIWQNPFEIAANSIDDDGNGNVDDINGWNVSDNNNSITPPPGRLQEYYHGTHVAGIITRIGRTVYGSTAPDAISIMPVKSLSDHAPSTAIRQGYQGIEYAVRAGADIVLCAWSVGHISTDEEKILRRAREKGVLVISSAGNFPDERDMYPAADSSVLAVTALNKENKISAHSNYGTFVDLAAPGVDIESASSSSDTSYESHKGTSQAAAMVAGAAAVMMVQRPDAANETVIACLKNTSTFLKPESQEYSVKQGAGLLNIKAAVDCMNAPPETQTIRLHPQGYLNLSAVQPGTTSWTIKPSGKFKGIWFMRPELAGLTGQTTISFYGEHTGSGKPLASFPLASMPERFFVAGVKAVVTIKSNTEKQNTNGLLMEYRAEAINFRTLYCRETVYLTEQGSFDDGSGSNPYSPNSDCKWQITAPEGKVIQFKFNEFETEPRTDLVYFFNGKGTHEKIMAIFSGTEIPTEIYTWQNQVLVWFVTNGENQGQGWKGEFYFVDKNKAIYPESPKAEK